MRKTIAVGATIALAAAAVAASVTFASPGRPSSVDAGDAALARVSNKQRVPIQLPSNDARAERLKGSGFGNIFMIAKRGNRAFFKFELANGRSCYGVGDVARSWPFGAFGCRNQEPFFPSPEQPIFDHSVVGKDNGDAYVRFIRVQGFAADGVARIGLRNPERTIIAETPVADNVYLVEQLPNEPVTSIVALDAEGKAILEIP